MQQPPKFPWVKGVQPDYRSIAIRVAICQDNDHNVWSYSDLEDDTDKQTVTSMNGYGVEQIAFGLLCEAVRREAYLQALIRLTRDSDYIEKFTKGDAGEQSHIRSELGKAIEANLNKSIHSMAQEAAAEILAMLTA